MSLRCRRWRIRFPDSRRFAGDAKSEVTGWSKSNIVAMDASERAHAQMRQDLTSSGPGKDPSAAVDRFLCQQVHAAHQVKGGSCISEVLPVAAVERAGGRDEFNASTAEASAVVAVDAATPPP